jgi:hypothetical protein
MGATRQALPTVTGFAVKCAIAALRQRSTDPGPLLHRAGLAEGDRALPSAACPRWRRASFSNMRPWR